LGAGDYHFAAAFAGDANYNAATSDDEPFTVDKGTLTLTTEIHNAADNSVIANGSHVPIGTSAYDTASFSGLTPGFTPDIGQLSFTFDGAAAGSDSTQSDTEGPLGAGDHHFAAAFAGDANYNPATSDDEPFTVDKATPTLTTQAVPTGGIQGVVALNDTATLSGAFNPTGTITFTLRAPDNSIVATEIVQVDHGNGVY